MVSKLVEYYKKKYVYIWAKYSLESKQNKAERAIFREKLETYLKAGQVATEVFQVWFWAQSRRAEYSVRRTCAMKLALVYECLGASAGHVEVTGKKCQVKGAEVEFR